jgi:hypothetical protein
MLPEEKLPFRRLECSLGEEAQVDFGQGAWIEEQGRRYRPHVFRIVLSYSRKAYSEVVRRQTTEVFVGCLENAWWHFWWVGRASGAGQSARGGAACRLVWPRAEPAAIEIDGGATVTFLGDGRTAGSFPTSRSSSCPTSPPLLSRTTASSWRSILWRSARANSERAVGAHAPATLVAKRRRCRSGTGQESSDEGADNQRGVLAAEAEAVAQGVANMDRAGVVRDVVEVALRVGILVVDRRR